MLIELTIKSSLVLAVALAAVATMRQSAATRHTILASAFVATLTLPILAAIGPHWRLPFVSRLTTTSQPLLPYRGPATHRRDSVPQTLQGKNGASTAASRWSAGNWLRLFTIVWLVGVAINVIRLVVAIASAMRLARDADVLTNSDWHESLSSVGDSISLARRVTLRTSNAASVPLAWRLGKTCTLILPIGAERWQADTRRAVLLHECGHLERHDCAIRSLAVLACGVWWFNPLAHLALRRLRREQERACDDVALIAGLSPLDYARHLLDVARRSVATNANATAFVAMIHRSELEDRMFAIVDPSRLRDSSSPRARLFATAVVLFVVAGVGALRLSAERTHSFEARLQATGPGGPQFEWRREVDVETRARVTSALDAASRDNDAQVRAVADRALQIIRDMPEGTVVVSRPCRGNCFVGSGAVPAAAQVLFESETKMALLELAGRTDTARRHAVPRLWAHSETGAEMLSELLGDPDPEVRALAAIRLDSVIFPPAVPRWIDLLADKDDSLRERAAISLGAIGDPAAVTALTSVLLDDPNPDVRRQAARSLSLIATGN